MPEHGGMWQRRAAVKSGRCSRAKRFEVPLLTNEDYLNERIELIDRLWGTGDFVLGRYLPTVSVDEARSRSWARFERQSATFRTSRHVACFIAMSGWFVDGVGA